MTGTPDILIVEDDTELRELLNRRLSDSGYHTRLAENGLQALVEIQEKAPDLVLLDIMLPEMDGLEVCRRIRTTHPLMYIIMLTAKTDEIDRVVGLEVGADDYVTKPFGLSELVARVRSALRRIRLTEEGIHSPGEAELLTSGDLYIDVSKRVVTVGASTVVLTVLEFDLLVYLVKHPDQPQTRMQLLDKVWDIQYEGYDRTVDSHIQRLRSKIEADPANPTYIKTVWGLGYKFQSQPSL